MMLKLTDKYVSIINKYCGEECVRRYQGIAKRDSENTVRIVNTGMVSSGKSSLFNILIDRNDEEQFPIGAARTTTASKSYEYKNITYIDTPGIDVCTEDDILAFNTIIESDIILMVHNIRTGPLNLSEVEWLKRIVSKMKDVNMCRERLVFVCTWKDTRDKDEDYENIIADVKTMVFSIINAEIPFFDISVKRYKSGMEKSSDILIDKSSVNDLKNFLEIYSKEYASKKQRIVEEEYRELLYEIREKLQNRNGSNIFKLEKIKEEVNNKNSSKKDIWENITKSFSSMRRKLSSLERKYSKEMDNF